MSSHPRPDSLGPDDQPFVVPLAPPAVALELPDDAATVPELREVLDILEAESRIIARAVELISRMLASGDVEAATGVPLELWLSQLGHATRADRRMLLKAATTLVDMPATFTAFRSGQLSWSQTRAIVDAASRLRQAERGVLDDALVDDLAAARSDDRTRSPGGSCCSPGSSSRPGWRPPMSIQTGSSTGLTCSRAWTAPAASCTPTWTGWVSPSPTKPSPPAWAAPRDSKPTRLTSPTRPHAPATATRSPAHGAMRWWTSSASPSPVTAVAATATTQPTTTTSGTTATTTATVTVMVAVAAGATEMAVAGPRALSSRPSRSSSRPRRSTT
ncbi:MAG: DUF222 domain-containing protein [Actinobacteria bacterium]|nr:DUF222 domain-containing protein [Actinomycetota bacterium]